MLIPYNGWSEIKWIKIRKKRKYLVYVFGNDGVCNQALNTKEKTAIAKARKKLELVLGDVKSKKYTEPKHNQNEYLDETILSKVQGSKVQRDIAISDMLLV